MQYNNYRLYIGDICILYRYTHKFKLLICVSNSSYIKLMLWMIGILYNGMYYVLS